MYINGMTNMEDVINMIKDTIDEGRLEDAKDYLDQLKDKGKPIAGVEYSLTGGPGQPSIANGNTWEESRVEDQKDKDVKMPFPDARDQHLISKNLNKATGGK